MKSIKDIVKKANKCLECQKKACTVGCPLDNDIKGFIKSIKNEDYKEAYNILSKTTILESICGRICPHEKQCQGSCHKEIKKAPVKIGELESFIGDLAIKNEWKIRSKTEFKHNVAVIGGGPAGLTCAAFLKKNGINVTIYEKHNYLGGLLSHGIPEFRLPKEITEKTIQRIIDLGIDVKYNEILGKTITLNELTRKYDAIFIGIGANISNKMKITGEKLKGVFGANEFLENKKEIDLNGKTVIISGGGNVAMDIARTVKRDGAKKVIIVYRKTEKELTADIDEVNAAKKDGIKFLYKNNITKINGKKQVTSIDLIKTDYKKVKDKEILVNVKGTRHNLECDYVIRAIGSHANSKTINSLGLETTVKGRIKIDKKGHTSKKKVFAGGDVAGNIGTVAWAARAGRNAAYGIIEYLNGKKV
ncbi:MAG: FAD-dependent oxidoreductase [Bacilli bacterium]|nr:FAD-dependent oxidoreductase [Bacilli bacterium]